MLLVDRAHQCCRWWKDLVDEDENSLLGCELDTLPYHVHELSHSKILNIGVELDLCWCYKTRKLTHRRHKILLLVNSRNIRPICLLANYLEKEQSATRVR